MKVESVSTDIDFIHNRIKRTITKTLVDEVTQKKFNNIEVYFETYNKNGKLEVVEKHQVDQKV